LRCASTAASPIPPAAGTTAPRWRIWAAACAWCSVPPHHEALHTGDTLELPLPPEATPRQIQDRAEAWLREQAKRILEQVIAQKFLEGRTALALAGRRAPRLALSFAARGHWVEAQGGDVLRCNWRLIEQSLPVIEQAITLGIAALPAEDQGFDLFGGPGASPTAHPAA
jgi:hypothetical protein